jgi:phenylacetate-CoA ligase
MDYEGIPHVMFRQYDRWRRFIPPKWQYHRDHFAVRSLLDDRPEVRDHIANVRLRHVLSTAVAHVPFYRNKVRIPAGDLVHAPLAELLERFPTIDKDTVMEQHTAFLNDRADRRQLVYAAGPGIWRSRREIDIESAFYYHAWGRLGFDANRSRYLRVAHDGLDAVARAARRLAPHYLLARPDAALALADLLAHDDRAAGWPLRAVLLAPGPATPDQIARIGHAFGVPVSISRAAGARTHLAFALHADGATSPYRLETLFGFTETPGHDGAIAGTSLWNEAMPLIRYRAADFLS